MGLKASKLSNLVGARGVYKRLEGPSSSSSSSLPPKGYVPICVGSSNGETKRFMVHTKSFGDADFMELLWKSAEEYGFCNDGVLKLRCEAEEFEKWMIKGDNLKIVRVQENNGLVDFRGSSRRRN